MNQVITIHPDGLASGLQHKRGKGLDLRVLGAVSIQRVTQIEWDEDEQAWFIKFVDGPRAGTEWDLDALRELAGDSLNGDPPEGTDPKSGHGERIYFRDYDEAVATEVAVLDRDRLSGIMP